MLTVLYTIEMDLSTAQQILVVILSTALAVLLLLAVVIAILTIRLLMTLQIVADKAEKVVESAEAVGHVIKNVAGPVGVLRFARSVFEVVSKHKESKR